MTVIDEKAKVVEYPQGPLYGGAAEKVIQRTIDVAAGDDDGSEWLIGEIPGEAIITGLAVLNTAISGGTVYDLGIADQNGVILSANKLFDDVDMSSARTSFTQVAFNAGAANCAKSIAELVSHVNKVVPGVGEVAAKAIYRLILKGVTAGGAGTIVIQVRYRDSI